MAKQLVPAVLLMGMSFHLLAQNNGKIELRKQFGSYQFFSNGKKLSFSTVSNRLVSNPEAFKVFKSAETKYIAGSLVGALGGSLMGYAIGNYLFNDADDKKFPWTTVGIGAGLVVVVIPINTAYNRQAKKAVDLFNSGSGALYKKNFHMQATVGFQKVGLLVSLM